MEQKRMTFVQALKDYFGLNGKDNMAFMQEFKALSDVDKAFFREALPSVGYEIVNA